MCTLSVITLGESGGPHLAGTVGFRVVMNRDELRGRLSAVQPRWRSVTGRSTTRKAIWPVDPKGGGTWIAAGEHGLVLCLLNMNPEPEPMLPVNVVSRGVVIPRLIACAQAGEAMERLREQDLGRFAPFRLVAMEPCSTERAWNGHPRIVEARWDREHFEVLEHHEGMECFASSGLGDSRVQVRRELFEDMVARDPSACVQDSFHEHRWGDAPEISVMMSRGEARTVSVTSVEVLARAAGGVHVRMEYHPVFEAAMTSSVALR